MKTCKSCGAESYRIESKYCLKCGSELPQQESRPHQNICTNETCQWHRSGFIYPDDARFCDGCGTPTAFGQ